MGNEEETNPAPHITNVINDVPVIVKESKAGYKTTEFWLVIAVSVLTTVQALPLPEKAQGIVVAALGIAYAISRGLAKKGIPAIEPEVPAK